LSRHVTAPLVAALAAVYVIWGSTYLAIKLALEDFPPFSQLALRFLVAGLAMFLVLLLRGAPRPTARQWRDGAIVGILLPAAGTGSVVWAERTVASGIAALVIATVPLWAACFAGLFGRWPSRRQCLGLLIGFGGVALLCLRGELSATPGGAALLVGAAAVWAFGSVWSRRLDIPKGPMAPAIQMIVAGAVTGAMSLLAGERPAWPPGAVPLAALAYLVVFGSIVAYSAYAYLLAHTTPAVATSYGYVNPVVALLLGVADGEKLGTTTIAALPVILVGLALVLTGRGATSRSP
jgi:drug/metabolite transporter (DMT)-like permease